MTMFSRTTTNFPDFTDNVLDTPGGTNDNFLGDIFYNDNPTAAWFNQFSKAGGANPLGEFLRGSQGRYYNQYLAQLPQNPNMLFTDFIKGKNPEQEFQGLSPRSRGMNPSMFAPQVRFVNRRFG